MKKALSIIISIAFVLSAFVPAFASDEKPALTYNEYSYSYAGDIDGSPVTISLTDNDVFSYYTIKAGKAGFYEVSFRYETNDSYFNSSVNTAFTDETENNLVTGEKEFLFDYDENIFSEKYLVYLDVDVETIMLIDAVGDGTVVVSLDYTGTLTSVTYTSPVICNYDGSYGYVDEEDDSICISSLICFLSATFTSGETFEFNDFYYCDGDINTVKSVTINGKILGQYFSVVIPVVSASELIRSISLPEGFEPEYSVDYYGEVTSFALPDYYIVKFADGTTANVIPGDGFTIPSTGSRVFDVDSFYVDGEFIVYIAGFEAKFDADEEKLSFSESLSYMMSNLKNTVTDGFSVTDSGEGIGSKVSSFFTSIRNMLFKIREEIAYFFDYVR